MAYRMTYKVIAKARKRRGRTMICDMCKKPYTDRIDEGAKGVICSLCAMGLADGWDRTKRESIPLEELLEAIKERRIDRYRSKYGLTQADLGRFLGFSTRTIKRFENSQYIPIDKLYKRVREKIDLSPGHATLQGTSKRGQNGIEITNT